MGLIKIENEGILNWRGIPLQIESLAITAGRKTQVIDYINSGNRTIQDLGTLPKTFMVSAFLDLKEGGATRNSIQALITALEKQDMSKLQLPNTGRIYDVQQQPATITQSYTNQFGLLRVEAVFNQVTPTILNSKFQGATQGAVESSITQAFNDMKESASKTLAPISKRYKTARKYKQSAAKIISNISLEFNKISNSIQQAGGDIEDFNNTLTVFIDSYVKLINSPALLIQSIGDSFQALESSLQQGFNSAFNAPETLINKAKMLFSSFTQYKSVYKLQGNISKQVAIYENSMNESIRINALLTYINTASKIKYTRAAEIQGVKKEVSEYIDSIDWSNFQSVKQSVDEAYNYLTITLDDTIGSLPTLLTTTLDRPYTLTELAYILYNEQMDLGVQDLIAENNFASTTSITGTVNYLKR